MGPDFLIIALSDVAPPLLDASVPPPLAAALLPPNAALVLSTLAFAIAKLQQQS
jgi:hypothetical protein